MEQKGTREQFELLDEMTPADKKILQILKKGRNVPINITDQLDYNDRYLRRRLATLHSNEIIQRVGHQNSGLYEITQEGRAVYKLFISIHNEDQ